MRTWALCGGAVVALAAAQPALAGQCATVSFSPGSLSIANWDPISPGAQRTSFTMTVTRLDSATTGIRLMFLDSNDSSQPVRLGTNGNKSGPPYQVLDSSGTNIVYPKNSDVTTLKGQPAFVWQNKKSNNTLSGSFQILVPQNTGSDFSNGTYGETLNYAIQCLNNGGGGNVVQGPVSGPSMSLIIPNLVSLNMAHSATLDFQGFTSLTQQLNVGLKSTGPVNVAISTPRNDMKMVRSGAPSPAPDNSTIPYLIKLDGQNVAPLPATLTHRRAGVPGTTWPFVLTLPSAPSGKVAGSYSDTITLTLTPGT